MNTQRGQAFIEADTVIAQGWAAALPHLGYTVTTTGDGTVQRYTIDPIVWQQQREFVAERQNFLWYGTPAQELALDYESKHGGVYRHSIPEPKTPGFNFFKSLKLK